MVSAWHDIKFWVISRILNRAKLLIIALSVCKLHWIYYANIFLDYHQYIYSYHHNPIATTTIATYTCKLPECKFSVCASRWMDTVQVALYTTNLNNTRQMQGIVEVSFSKHHVYVLACIHACTHMRACMLKWVINTFENGCRVHVLLMNHVGKLLMQV